MANYAADSDLLTVFQNIHAYAKVANTTTYLTAAHEWLTSILSLHMTVPTASPSKILVLAEANYAIHLIMMSRDEQIKSQAFYDEAYRLLGHAIKCCETSELGTSAARRGGPVCNAENVQPIFTTGKKDSDGVLLGNRMGTWDEKKGSLDDW